jgi:hypothetical protein
MQRKKPLTTKKPLRGGGQLRTKKGLTQSTPLVAKKRLKPRSDKMQRAYEERRPFVKDFLEKKPYCEVQWDSNCQGASVDVHETMFRSHGGAIVGDDPTQFVATCRYCHGMIHDNPEEAHKRGFRKWSWEK